MNDQRMVDVGVLRELRRILEELERLVPAGYPITTSVSECYRYKLRAIIDGPGVGPVATKLETQQFDCFHVSAEDAAKLRALPVGANLYLAAPSAPVQAVPDGWQLVPKEPTTDDRKDAERYRWLRHGDNNEYVLRTHFSAHDGEETTWLLRNAELDAAIDAAIASEKENERGT